LCTTLWLQLLMDKDQEENISHAPAQNQEYFKTDSKMNSNRITHSFCKTTPTVMCTCSTVQTTILCTSSLGNKHATTNDNSHSYEPKQLRSAPCIFKARMKWDYAEIKW
jgi:hypothetical protein